MEPITTLIVAALANLSKDVMNQLQRAPKGNNPKKMTAQELCAAYAEGHRDFSNIILKDQSLRDADLREANFRGANFKRINFKEAQLQHTNFSGAKLRSVDFSEADLTDANFSQVEAIGLLSWSRILILGFLSIILVPLFIITLVITLGYSFLLLSYLPLFRVLWLRTKFNQANLSGTCFRGAKLRHIDFSTSLNLEKVNFHGAWLQGASFRGLNLEKSDFSQAKLYGTNFSETRLNQSGFQHSKTGASSNFGFSLLKTIALSWGGFFIAFIPGAVIYALLDTQLTNDQYFSVFTSLAIVTVGFFHFSSASLFKNMDEALTGLGFMAGSILLVLTNQPILITLVWIPVLVGIIRIIQILWQVNSLAAVFLPLLLTISCIVLLYTYHSVGELIEYTAAVLVMLVFMSIRIAVTIAEVEVISGWGKWISSFISIALFLVSLFALNTIDNSEQTMLIFLAISSILLGWYIGLQTIKDNPNYRIIRDRAIAFCHLGGRFGTLFRGSNLSLADFSFASLKNADFTNANLTHAVWYGSQQLKYARFGRNNYLRYPQIRQLLTLQTSHFPHQSQRILINRKSSIYRKLPKVVKKLIYFCLTEKLYKVSKNFDNFDLRGIRLSSPHSDDLLGQSAKHKSFDLANASFEGADLRYADLRNTNLQGVSFVSAELDQADLSGADLTDACIQDWQVTPATRFEQVRCKRLQLEKRISKDIEPASKTLDQGEFPDFSKLQELIIPVEQKKKLDGLKNEFAKLDLLRNKVHRKYHLRQQANLAADSYGIDPELYCEMFEDYRRQKVQAQRQQSWWQSILWFKVEPWIEKINQLTQELDIFPLLENLGRLSILVAVITFVNTILKPDVDIEKQYRPWEIIHSDTQQEVRGVSRYALEQLRAEGASLEGLQAPNIDLQRINLSNVNLSYANLEGANLKEAKLKSEKTFPIPEIFKKDTNLTKAKLTKANLTEADLTEANLTKANLTGANLTGANLTGANLTDANLTDANLTGANLTKANLTEADLTEADLTGANLTDANLINQKTATKFQIKSACFWEEAKYKGKWNKTEKKWTFDEKENDKYIQQLTDDKKSSYPKQNPDCNRFKSK